MLVLNLKFNQAARLETTFNHQNSFTGTKVREQLVSTPEQSFSVHHDDVPYLWMQIPPMATAVIAGLGCSGYHNVSIPTERKTSLCSRSRDPFQKLPARE